MNILTGVVLLILAAFAFHGWKKGFVRVFAHMFFFLASAILVYFATPYISDFLKEHTPVYGVIEESCRKTFMEKDGEKEDTRLEQKKFIEGLGLPEVLKKQLVNQNNDDSYQGLEITDFSEYLAAYMASLILNILTFVITLLLVNLLLRMTVLTLDNLSRLPVLHPINQTLGLILGAGQGLLIVWVAFLVITVFGNTDTGKKLLMMIHQSVVLEWLYNMNIFLEYLLRIVTGMG